MNWETYSLMTDKQKEEYNYRFRDELLFFDITGLRGSITAIMSFFCLSMMIIYMGMKEMIFSQELVNTMLKAIGYGPIIFIFLALFYVIGFFIQLIIRTYKENKWLKDNKIVKIKKVLFNGN